MKLSQSQYQLHFIFFFFFLITLLTNCSTKPVEQKPEADNSNSIYTDYKLAKSFEKKDQSISCQLYSKLAEQKEFPLYKVALLKSRIFCLDVKEDLQTSDFTSEKWLEKLLIQALAEEGKKKSDSKRIIASNSYKMGADWIVARDFKKGRKFLKQTLLKQNISLEEQYKIRLMIRNSYKIEQNQGAYLTEMERMASWVRTKTKRIDWQFDTRMAWARAVWTEGLTLKAKEILLNTEKRFKNKISLADTYYVLGKMEEADLSYQKAISYFDQALAEKEIKIPLRNKLLFARAWNLRNLNQFNEAIKSFLALKESSLESYELNKIRFWLAKTQLQVGLIEEANKTFNELISEDPLGFYGMVAYHELSKNFPPLFIKDKKNASDFSSQFPEKQLIEALIAVEENELLESYLGRFFSFPSNVKIEILQKWPELLFPRKYNELIEPLSEKWSLSSALVLSIIRQESSFNVRARSRADAFGLMQVLPQVAKKYSQLAGVTYENHQDLYDPSINIPIGVAMLSSLHRKYKGQIALMAAAYNAGEHSLDQWIRERLKNETIEFIEDIPYEETKTYVKLVLRNYIFYSRLKNPQETLSFPMGLLDNLEEVRVSTK